MNSGNTPSDGNFFSDGANKGGGKSHGICPQCGSLTQLHDRFCQKCGFRLQVGLPPRQPSAPLPPTPPPSQPSSPAIAPMPQGGAPPPSSQPFPPAGAPTPQGGAPHTARLYERHRLKPRGFNKGTLLIVGILVLVALAIAYVPYCNFVRDAHEEKARIGIDSFTNGARLFYASNYGLYWENGEAEFGGLFSSTFDDYGYGHKYFSDDLLPDDSHEAAYFVFLVYPEALNDGRKAFYIDEKGRKYSLDILSEDMLVVLKAVGGSEIKWDDAQYSADSRLNVRGLAFKQLLPVRTIRTRG